MVKNGRSENGRRRYRRAAMNAAEIFKMNAAAMHGNQEYRDITFEQQLRPRDIERNLGISKDTVISELKKNSSRSESIFQPSSGRN